MADVIVIGAGLGGLCAAISSAASGLRVEVVEAGDGPGGKAGIASFEGVEFDTGPSVLTLPEVFDGIFREAGTRLEDEVGLRAISPGFRYLYPDGAVVDVHHDLEATLASVAGSLGQGTADELADFLGYARGIWEAAAPHFVFGPAPSLQEVGRLARGLPALLRIDPLRSMRGAIRSRVRSPHLRALLMRYATYNGSDPRRAPATLNCIAHVELAMGGYGVEGGIFELVRALVRVGERLGVRYRYDLPVERILVEGGRATGIALSGGGERRAEAVICNADVAHLAQDLLSEVRCGLSAPSEPSMSGWTGVFKARRRSDARTPHTVLFPADYLEEFADIFDRGRPPREPTVYLCAQERCHGRAGWVDHEPLFAMANAPALPAGGEPERDLRLLEPVLARCRAAGLVDSDDALVWARTPAGLAARFPGSRGGIYGAASNSRFAAFQRPSNRIRRLPGLYLASGSAHPGGGMPLCARSGQAAARALIQDLTPDRAPRHSLLLGEVP